MTVVCDEWCCQPKRKCLMLAQEKILSASPTDIVDCQPNRKCLLTAKEKTLTEGPRESADCFSKKKCSPTQEKVLTVSKSKRNS